MILSYFQLKRNNEQIDKYEREIRKLQDNTQLAASNVSNLFIALMMSEFGRVTVTTKLRQIS